MDNDRNREIHFQPTECGNCGTYFTWDPVAEEWGASCRCAELPVDPPRWIDGYVPQYNEHGVELDGGMTFDPFDD